MKKILIIQTAFLGDVLLATGVIQKLKNKFPEAQLDFILKKENHSVLAGQPAVNKIYLFDRKEKRKSLIQLIKAIRKERYDLVVNMHRFASSGIITMFSGASYTIGFDKNPFSLFFSKSVPHIFGDKSTPFHEIQRNNSLIEDFTDAHAHKPYLFISDGEKAKVANYQQTPYVCIAPTSVWYTKQLPEEKWAALIRKLPDTVMIYLLGGNSDVSACERVKNNARKNNVKILAGKLSLTESAALMQGAVLNYVNDSAPTHLASAVNAPVCTVYCSTVPEFGFGPLSDFSRIVETNKVLTCRPCNLHGFKNCPKSHFNCATTIDVDQMYRVFEEAASL